MTLIQEINVHNICIGFMLKPISNKYQINCFFKLKV